MYRGSTFKLTMLIWITVLMAGCVEINPMHKSEDVPKIYNEKSQATIVKKQNVTETNNIINSNQLKQIATQFINSKYQGDNKTLIDITKESARQDVEEGKLEIFKKHKLERIVSFTFEELNDPNVKKLIVGVSALQPGASVSTIYYEHFWFEKYGENWYITKNQRDA